VAEIAASLGPSFVAQIDMKAPSCDTAMGAPRLPPLLHDAIRAGTAVMRHEPGRLPTSDSALGLTTA
jgi:hypothetical protein